MVKRSEDHKKPPADENAALLFLGLATRAGKTVSGYDAVQQAVFAGAAHLVLVAADASEGTANKARIVSEEYEVPFFRFATKDKLGKYLGKEERAVAAVLDEGFAKRLIQMIGECSEVTVGENIDRVSEEAINRRKK